MLFDITSNLKIEPDGEELWRAKSGISNAEKQRIIDWDNANFEVYGYHIVTNIDELISATK